MLVHKKGKFTVIEKPFKRLSDEEHEAADRERKLLRNEHDARRVRTRFSVTLPDHVMVIARKAGHGNASRGIEAALEEWDARTGTRKPGPKIRKLEKSK